MFAIKMFKVENGDHHFRSVTEAVNYSINDREDSISYTPPKDPNQDLISHSEMVTIKVQRDGGWQKVVVENAAGKTIDTLIPR